jgi:hypothetical protein
MLVVAQHQRVGALRVVEINETSLLYRALMNRSDAEGEWNFVRLEYIALRITFPCNFAPAYVSIHLDIKRTMNCSLEVLCAGWGKQT